MTPGLGETYGRRESLGRVTTASSNRYLKVSEMWLADNFSTIDKSRILFAQPRYFMSQPSNCGVPAKAEVSVSHPRHN